MIVLPLVVVCPKIIIQDQVFIEFVDVEIVWHTKYLAKNSISIKSINI